MDTTTNHRRRPTLADVAAYAGVSAKSVSRVVNGEAHVSDALRDEVLAAVRTLGYRPDRRARDLASGMPRRLVGFVLVDAANPFFASVARGLEDTIQASDALVISGSTDADPHRETTLIETLVELRVDGLVIAAAEGDNELLRHEIELGTAVVLVDRVLADLDADTVVTDNRASTRTAVEHLLDLGHRDIAFLGGNPDVWTAKERHAGFIEALQSRGLEPRPGRDVAHVDATARAESAVADLLATDTPPTALLTAQDVITAGAMRALRDHDLQHEVAMIGFDDMPLLDLARPSVSVIAQDPYEMGRQAGECLLGRLDGTRTGPPGFIVVPSRIIHRESSAIRPSRS